MCPSHSAALSSQQELEQGHTNPDPLNMIRVIKLKDLRFAGARLVRNADEQRDLAATAVQVVLGARGGLGQAVHIHVLRLALAHIDEPLEGAPTQSFKRCAGQGGPLVIYLSFREVTASTTRLL